MKGGVVSERKKGHWSLEEDLRLIQVVNKHGEGRWTKLAKAAGLWRCGKSCRLRWLNYLRPDLKRGNISEEEEVLITDLQSVYGNRWSMIALHLPGRSDNEIKNYWRSHTKKTIKLQQYNAIHRRHAMDFTKNNDDNDGFHQQYDTVHHCQTTYFTNNSSDTTIAMHGIQQVASTTSACCLSNDVDVSLSPPDDVPPHPSIIAGPSLWHLRHHDHDDVAPFINVSSPPPMNTSHSSSNESHTNPNKTLPTTTTITNPNTTLPTTTTTITTTTLDYFSNEANNTMSDWEIESILEVHSTMHDYDDSQTSSDLWVFNDELYNHVPAPNIFA